jgi:Cys-rich protein (TIGR01571 family)
MTDNNLRTSSSGDQLDRSSVVNVQPKPANSSNETSAVPDRPVTQAGLEMQSRSASSVGVADVEMLVTSRSVKWSTGLCACGPYCCHVCMAYTATHLVLGELVKHMRLTGLFVFSNKNSTSVLQGLRAKLRSTYQIQGNECDDCCASCCCPGCVVYQMHRELSARGLFWEPPDITCI